MKYALCTGINDYPGSDNDLGGCVNDARDWRDMLQRRQFNTDLLIDGEVKRETVISRLQAVVEYARLGDHIAFTYSGHGTWVPDKDGDEADRRDEALCMWDFQSGGLLLDDDINRIFAARRRGVRVTIISDSCHSGTVLKALQVPRVEKKPRFISPGVIDSVPITEERAIEMEMTVRLSRPRPTAILLSGCSDLEYSYDANFGGKPNGAFTKFALAALSEEPRSYASWHKKVRQSLPNSDYPQTPQLGSTTYQRYLRPFL